MKKLFKKCSLTAAMLFTVAANATVILPGGVKLAPGATDLDNGVGNFNNQFNFLQWWDNTSNNTGSRFEQADFLVPISDANGNIDQAQIADYANNWVLNGVGEITMPQSTAGSTAVLACASCELTFEFGGIGLTPIIETTTIVVPGQGQVSFDINTWALDTSSAFLNVYADSSVDVDFNVLDDDNALDDSEYDLLTGTGDGDSELWLSLAFEEDFFNPSDVFDGFGGLTAGDSYFSFQVTGGSAMDNFVDNSIRDVTAVPNFDIFADILGLGLSASFGEDSKISSGTSGDLTGVAIPAPATIALFGLGLVGVSLVNRKRKK